MNGQEAARLGNGGDVGWRRQGEARGGTREGRDRNLAGEGKLLTASKEVEVDGGVEARDLDELLFGGVDRLVYPREGISSGGGRRQPNARQNPSRVVDIAVDLPFGENPERQH